jgi:hypothetical protein
MIFCEMMFMPSAVMHIDINDKKVLPNKVDPNEILATFANKVTG